MPSQKKILENLHSKVIDEYRGNIELFTDQAPQLIKNLKVKERDPHVEQMIDAFALIHASYRYNNTVVADKQVNSILFNILDMKLYAPCGQVLAYNNDNSNYVVKKGTLIKDQDNIFVVAQDSHINHLEIKGKKLEIINGAMNLILTFDVENSNFTTINLFTHEDVITALFLNKHSKNVTVYNRDEYTTVAQAKWQKPNNIQDSIHFAHKYNSFTIENIDMVGVKKQFSIAIPLEENMDILAHKISTNKILIQNSFFDMSENIFFTEDNYQYNLDLPGKEIIDILNLYIVTEEETFKLDPATINSDGWYAIVEEDRISVGFASIKPEYLYFYCEVKCINTHLHHNQLEFDEYAPVKLLWDNYMQPPCKNVYKTNVALVTSLLNIKVENIAQAMENLIGCYDPFSAMKIVMDRKERIVKIDNYGHFQIPKEGYRVYLSTSNLKMSLLHGAIGEIRKHIDCFLHFIIKTPKGTLDDFTY